MAKPEKRKLAREMRSNGDSIKHIAGKLEVAQSSVSLWCRDIKLTQNQILNLEKNARDPLYGRRLSYALKQQKAREMKSKVLLERGIEKVGHMSKRELFLTGAALYWAEGFKKDSQAGFANSSPEMLKVFVKWLRVCFGYNVEDLIFRVTLNESHKYRVEEVQRYWSGQLNVSIENFRKPYFQKVKWKKEYDNPEEYFGVLRIKVRKSTDFLREIRGFIEGLGRNGD